MGPVGVIGANRPNGQRDDFCLVRAMAAVLVLRTDDETRADLIADLPEFLRDTVAEMELMKRKAS